ncbi:MAG TPA: OmpA family protein, partial [Rubricoccaceae bacterium]
VAAEIQGHTDSESSRSSNRILSIRRAEATRDYLVQKGIDSERLAPRGFGETDPIADNDTEAGRARNRRVVFSLRTL